MLLLVATCRLTQVYDRCSLQCWKVESIQLEWNICHSICFPKHRNIIIFKASLYTIMIKGSKRLTSNISNLSSFCTFNHGSHARKYGEAYNERDKHGKNPNPYFPDDKECTCLSLRYILLVNQRVVFWTRNHIGCFDWIYYCMAVYFWMIVIILTTVLCSYYWRFFTWRFN